MYESAFVEPILVYPIEVILVFNVPSKYLSDAQLKMAEVGQYDCVRYWDDQPGRVEVYGSVHNIENWAPLYEYMERCHSYFNDMTSEEVCLNFYLVDHDMHNQPEFGSIVRDDEGREWVEFTFGGPRLHHIRYPLSDYRLTR